MQLKQQHPLNRAEPNKITYFPDSVLTKMTLPERFTFPFYYEPHPLARVAANELQQYLEEQKELMSNFDPAATITETISGKMFGVLVVEDKEGRVGYLWAFSGKLAGTNDHPRFVPPVFDMLTENSFFLKEQEVIDGVNHELEKLLSDEGYISSRNELEFLKARSTQELSDLKEQLKINKEIRRQRREQNDPAGEQYTLIEAELAKESHYDRHCLRSLKAEWKGRLEELEAKVSALDSRADSLRNERRERSAVLQEQLFERYVFLNRAGETRSLQDIFSKTAFGRPPSAAGECATPKLLQYAFTCGYKPLAMAEFWWGASPRSEIRKHRQFYPACTGKCKPILAHMLEGIDMDDNPFLQPAMDEKLLEIVFEDDYLLVVNKPSGLRSVPGVDIDVSVYSRLKSTMVGVEPLMVHRLDMGTSGLLVVAKTPGVHKHLQKQFLDRTVRKRYAALLSKLPGSEEGEIHLPLCADPFNRPRQLVCFETGKTSVSRWRVVERYETTAKVHFWPLTGRTHQLRVHAAHELGLNAPIAGDDIYGDAADRLYLHAAYLSFIHPVTKERMEFEVREDF